MDHQTIGAGVGNRMSTEKHDEKFTSFDEREGMSIGEELCSRIGCFTNGDFFYVRNRILKKRTIL